MEYCTTIGADVSDRTTKICLRYDEGRLRGGVREVRPLVARRV